MDVAELHVNVDLKELLQGRIILDLGNSDGSMSVISARCRIKVRDYLEGHENRLLCPTNLNWGSEMTDSL